MPFNKYWLKFKFSPDFFPKSARVFQIPLAAVRTRRAPLAHLGTPGRRTATSKSTHQIEILVNNI